MSTRRSFIAGLMAIGAAPRVTWGDVGSPAFLSGARSSAGQFVLAGLSHDGTVRFRVALPGRGHAAASHPTRAQAVAFARRPGVFALVIDCQSGAVLARLVAPKGRHFYGHGAYSPDGALLFTTENDFDNGTGMIGVWHAAQGFQRLGEFPSGGVGPHDIKMLPGTDMLVVANGGIETHPDMGRAKLNLPHMRPNLSYVSTQGKLDEQMQLPEALHKNSIRHLAVHPDGQVAFAMQWQGQAGEASALLGMHRRGRAPRLMQATPAAHRQLRGYAGSVALSGDGRQVAITSPRGGAVHVFDVASGALNRIISIPDVCGACAGERGFHFTTGDGSWYSIAARDPQVHSTPGLQWDNHLIAI